jgi:prolyl oligopeptidase
MPLVYPDTKKVEQVDDYHGIKIADPYRWLEDPESPETKAWVQAQNAVTFNWLAQVPQRERIRQRLTQLWNYERYGHPHKKGRRYFYSRNDGLQNQNAVYVVEKLDGQPRLLMDPNTLAADGTIALKNWAVSDNGKLMAFGLAGAGSDWEEWGVLDVDSGRTLPDKLKWVKFSRVSWTPDNAGFYYSRYDEPPPGETYTGQNYFQKLYYHRLGQPQEEDTLVYERKDQKEWGFDGEVTEDGKYLIISVWRGTEPKNLVFYQELPPAGHSGSVPKVGQPASLPVTELISAFQADYSFLGNDGPVFWFSTDNSAPLRRVIAIDTRQPDRANWKEIIPESRDTLEHVSLIGDHFIASYLKDAAASVRVFDLAGKHVRDVPLPGLGSVGGFGGRRDDSETFYSFTSYTTPGSIYRYDAKSGEAKLFRQPKVDFDPAKYETKQVFLSSKDGTRVPMMITSRKGLELSGQQPTILYAYGGFNNALTPGFSVGVISWLEMGGVYAVANLRGGSEYGREWHEAGMLDRKQNVFDDFLAAAQWLIDNKYTSSERLAIRGGSNGGLLVGAAMTQRPELFAAAVPAVGVMDMLRYHKFTIGWAWVSEYGSADDPAQFKTLLAYSPLHNLKAGAKYPATLVTTADHDDRVVPAHSFKYAAALQAAHKGDAPVLIRIETRAGHGGGTPTTKLIEQTADVHAFLARVLKMED